LKCRSRRVGGEGGGFYGRRRLVGCVNCEVTDESVRFLVSILKENVGSRCVVHRRRQVGLAWLGWRL
jgi:hypothetical protein